MLVKDVILKYHAQVPFPWSTAKLRKANLNPTAFLLEMGRELERCEDKDTPTAKALINTLRDLEMLS